MAHFLRTAKLHDEWRLLRHGPHGPFLMRRSLGMLVRLLGPVAALAADAAADMLAAPGFRRLLELRRWLR